MAEDFSATLAVQNLCIAAHLLRVVYDSACEFEDMTGVDPQDWDLIHTVLEKLGPLRSYGTPGEQSVVILQRLMNASGEP